MMKPVIRALLIALMLAPFGAVAALLPIENQLVDISSTPEHPRPGEVVLLTARATGGTGGYRYVWTTDGALLAEGVDITNVKVRAGSMGSRTEVQATLLASSGDIRGSRTFTIRPAEVDLLWEGDTYTPPFYRGRPLPGGESGVVVEAMPWLYQNGALLPADRLVYRWEVNGKAVPGSGYGKHSVHIASPFLDTPFSVSVVAQTLDGTYAAESKMTITPSGPFALVYEDAPLSGLATNRATAVSTTLAKDEVTFRAFPLFSGNPQNLSYQWKLNGEPFTLDATDPRAATFRRTGGAAGTFSVEFSFKNPGRLLESALNTFTVFMQ
jgi:hypothetical protein